MAQTGQAALVVALLTAGWAVVAALASIHGNRHRLLDSSRRAIYTLGGLLVGCAILLELAYARSDFSFALVAQNSSLGTPTFYKLSALWSSQAGSLLLWSLVLSLFTSIALRGPARALARPTVAYATAVLAGLAGFFIFLMLAYANPFETLSPPAADGNGLNPLLRNPMMLFHPPMLYSGYVGFAIPFAFCVGALVSRQTGADWLRATRRFALVAWTFLGLGLILGSVWSYSELGWGGYWGWDPVENAALMPWLVGTAYLHSIQIEEKRGMLRIWNVGLIMGTFVLSLLGTFLVRSGILNSIHAFGASTLGRPFLSFIAVVALGSVALVLSRLDHLRSDARLESLFSREGAFLLNNLVLVGLTFVIWWGTFFPLISEAVTGTKASVGPPWFNRYTPPLALALVLVLSVGPLLPWRRARRLQLWRTLRAPLGAAALVAVPLALLTPAGRSPASLLMFGLGALVVAGVAQELWRGTRARMAMTGERSGTALARLIARNRRRYGGYLVHVGLVMLLAGAGAASAFQSRRDVRIRPGQSVEVGGYKVDYKRPTARLGRDPTGTGSPIAFGAELRVTRGSKSFTLRPGRNYYPTGSDPSLGPISRYFSGDATSEVDATWGIGRDFWTALQPDITSLQRPLAIADKRFGASDAQTQAVVIAALVERYRRYPGAADLRVIVFPFVTWIWFGGVIAIAGAMLALGANRPLGALRLRGLYAARLNRELAR